MIGDQTKTICQTLLICYTFFSNMNMNLYGYLYVYFYSVYKITNNLIEDNKNYYNIIKPRLKPNGKKERNKFYNNACSKCSYSLIALHHVILCVLDFS